VYFFGFVDLELALAALSLDFPVGAFELHALNERALVLLELGLLVRVEFSDDCGNAHQVEREVLLARDDLRAGGEELERVEEACDPDALRQRDRLVWLYDISPLRVVFDAREQVDVPRGQAAQGVLTLLLPGCRHFEGFERHR